MVGCASELANSARVDELGTFRRKLESSAKQGEPKPLDTDLLLEVAKVVASRELVTSPLRDAERRVVEVADCASQLQAPLEVLAERGGAPGAIAVQVLIDADAWDGDLNDLVGRYSSDKRDEWRAVGLRSANQPGHAALRARGFLDADLRVRRAALRASRDAHEKADLSELLEVARLDPDRTSRRLALEAIGATADAEAVRRLRELWPQRDEEERLEITRVWSQEAVYAVGGEEQLAWAVSTQAGLPQLKAAVVLLGNGSAAMSTWAEGVLVEALESGTTEETRYAAEYAPRTKRVNTALSKLAASGDETRALWGAIALVRAGNENGVTRLRRHVDSTIPEVSDAAGYTLGRHGDAKTVEWLDAQIANPKAERRFTAAVVRFGDGATQAGLDRSALMLADTDASVRTRFACWLLSNPRPAFDYFHSQLRP